MLPHPQQALIVLAELQVKQCVRAFQAAPRNVAHSKRWTAGLLELVDKVNVEDALAGVDERLDVVRRELGRRYFILMADSGKLVVTDKSQFYKLRRRGSMPKAITPRMLPRISVYYTAGTYKGNPSPCMADTTAADRKQKYLRYIMNPH